jgi:hypothetical protein
MGARKIKMTQKNVVQSHGGRHQDKRRAGKKLIGKHYGESEVMGDFLSTFLHNVKEVCSEDISGNGGIAPPVLSLALGRMSTVSGQIHAPAASPRTHGIGGWVGLGTGLDAVEERRIRNGSALDGGGGGSSSNSSSR